MPIPGASLPRYLRVLVPRGLGLWTQRAVLCHRLRNHLHGAFTSVSLPAEQVTISFVHFEKNNNHQLFESNADAFKQMIAFLTQFIQPANLA